MEVFVCNESELKEKEPVFVSMDDMIVGVFLVDGQLHAIENRCPHFEGPVCLGDVTGRVLMELDENKKPVGSLAEYASEEKMNIVCPWHGIEFDLETGDCIPNKHLRLNKFDTEIKDGKVYMHTRQLT